MASFAWVLVLCFCGFLASGGLGGFVILGVIWIFAPLRTGGVVFGWVLVCRGAGCLWLVCCTWWIAVVFDDFCCLGFSLLWVDCTGRLGFLFSCGVGVIQFRVGFSVLGDCCGDFVVLGLGYLFW